MTMRASLIISAKDQASAAFGKIASGARSMAAAFKPVKAEARDTDRALDGIGGGAVGRFARIGAAARKMAGDMQIAERAAYGVGYGIGWSIRKTAGAALGLAKWGAIGAAGAAGFGISNLFTGVIRTGAQFEQFAVMLKTVTGSAEAARQSMDWVQKFAATTPYELEEVMGAFVKLKTRGLDPTDGTLRSLGDAASAMGKSIDDAVEMMADAVTGEFERLKEFGVVANQAGGQVTFRWMQNGKALTKTVKKDGQEIRKALADIFGGNYAGAMEGQSRTFSGMMSNLSDLWTGFQKRIADAGVFDLVKQKLSQVFEWANAAAEDGRMQKWAEDIAEGLKSAFEWASAFISQTNWKEVAGQIQSIAKAAWEVATAIASAVNAWVSWRQAVQDKNDRGVVNAPAARSAFGVRLWGVTEQERSDAKARLNRSNPAAPANSVKWPSQISGAMKKTTTPAKPLVMKAANDVKVGGSVEVKISAAPGIQARTTQVTSNNRAVPVTAKTGKAMAGAA